MQGFVDNIFLGISFSILFILVWVLFPVFLWSCAVILFGWAVLQLAKPEDPKTKQTGKSFIYQSFLITVVAAPFVTAIIMFCKNTRW